MLERPRCSIRQCKHFEGVKYLDEALGEASEAVVCAAFPDGIPREVAYGKNKHKSPLPGQGNSIVYERGERP